MNERDNQISLSSIDDFSLEDIKYFENNLWSDDRSLELEEKSKEMKTINVEERGKKDSKIKNIKNDMEKTRQQTLDRKTMDKATQTINPYDDEQSSDEEMYIHYLLKKKHKKEKN